MPNQPLQAFAPPAGFADWPVPATSALIEWAFYFAVAFWAVHTLVAVYHWIKYSHAAAVALPAIALHVVVSLVCITFALSGILV